jgi:hypothetical protein
VPGFGAAQSATQLLPDLDPAAPSGPKAIAATDGSGRIHLTFGVKIENNGAGPLIIRGERASTAEPQLAASQIVNSSDGTTTTVPGVGALVYDVEYARWGYQPYTRYELHNAADYALVGTGPDMNFCVNDSTNPSPALPGEPSSKVYGCAPGNPNLLTHTEGISVGWANTHAAKKKGQLIDITTLPTGSYILVHRVNVTSGLSESNVTNNASSALITITWRTGYTLPSVKLKRSCSSTETCA